MEPLTLEIDGDAPRDALEQENLEPQIIGSLLLSDAHGRGERATELNETVQAKRLKFARGRLRAKIHIHQSPLEKIPA